MGAREQERKLSCSLEADRLGLERSEVTFSREAGLVVAERREEVDAGLRVPAVGGPQVHERMETLHELTFERVRADAPTVGVIAIEPLERAVPGQVLRETPDERVPPALVRE